MRTFVLRFADTPVNIVRPLKSPVGNSVKAFSSSLSVVRLVRPLKRSEGRSVKALLLSLSDARAVRPSKSATPTPLNTPPGRVSRELPCRLRNVTEVRALNILASRDIMLLLSNERVSRLVSVLNTPEGRVSNRLPARFICFQAGKIGEYSCGQGLYSVEL